MKASGQRSRVIPAGWLPGALLLLVWTLSLPVLAVTLGDEEVLSWLGDPVEAEIGVLQWQDVDFAQVSFSIASRSEYEAFSLTWLPVLEQLNFNLIGPNSRGEVRVLISTRNPVAEPYIDLLLVMRWPGGSLLREIVLLFDLPPAARHTQTEQIVVRIPEISAEPDKNGNAGAPVKIEKDTVMLVADTAEVELASDTEPSLENVAQQTQSSVVSELVIAVESADFDPEDTDIPADIVVVERPVTKPLVRMQDVAARLGNLAGGLDAASNKRQAGPETSVIDENVAAVLLADQGLAEALTGTETEIVATVPDAVNVLVASEPEIVSDPEPEPEAVVAEISSDSALAEATVEFTDAALPGVRMQQAITVESLNGDRQTPGNSIRRVYQVRQGDILWNIAQQFLAAGSGENLYQMLLGLHDLNRSAFINGNISLLKAGAQMQIPSSFDIDAIAADSAQSVFDQRWADGTQRMQLASSSSELQDFSELNTGQQAPADAPLADKPAETDSFADSEAPGRPEDSGTNSSLLLPADAVMVFPAATDTSPGAATDFTGSDQPAEMAEPAVVQNLASETVVAESDGKIVNELTATDSSSAGRTDVGSIEVHSPEATVVSTASTVIPAEIQKHQDAEELAESDPDTFTDNLYLNRINDSARELESLLAARAMQIARLEEQLLEMRIRMRDAEQMASELGDSLQGLLQQRRKRDSSYQRNTAVLAGFSALLLLTVVMGAMLIVRLLALLRSQRRQLSPALRDSDMHLSAGADSEGPLSEPALPQGSEAKQVPDEYGAARSLGMDISELDDRDISSVEDNTHDYSEENELPPVFNKVD